MHRDIKCKRFFKKDFLRIALAVFFVFDGSMLSASEITGNVGLAARAYPKDAQYFNQESDGLSLSLQAEFRNKWDNNSSVFTVVPFYRQDKNDDERTHADLRQFDFVKYAGGWEYQVGISKVFWGVAESAHLVDIINQTDGVESLDGEDKLGQPLIKVGHIFENSTINFFVLPYFRERTFVGESGRLRSAFPVDTDEVSYESSKEEKHVDYAFRLQHTFSDTDVGLSYFDGTSRAPYFIPDFNTETLKQYYPLIKQTGLDVQYTGEKWIWKLEAINRKSEQENFTAEVAGFEYTIPSVVGTNVELGLLAEYHNDSRGEVIDAPFQNDIFVGARIVLSDLDAECLIGSFVDLDNHTKSVNLEFSSRIAEKFQLNIEVQAFADVAIQDPFYGIKNDGFIEVELKYFF